MTDSVLRSLRVLFGVLLLAACETTAVPDRILYNGRIWTGDSTRREVTALAIRDDRILAIGDDAYVRGLAGDSTVQEDLQGKRVVAGFHDAHWHLPTRRTADLVGAKDPVELIARLQAFAATIPSDAWITGRGWTPDMFPGNTAHKRYLDAAFPDRPMILTDRDGHQTLSNSRALTLAGVSAETREPAGGAIIRERDGTPTGLLQETASSLVRRMLPDLTTDDVYAALRYEMHRAAARGLTALQIANAQGAIEQAAVLRALRDDSLLVRLRIAVPFDKDASDSALRSYVALRDDHTGPLLRYGIAKGMLDGTVDAGTAAMLAPFAIGGGTGLPRFTAEELQATLARYDSAGLQVELHAIGDASIRMVLDAAERLTKERGARDRRIRIEHLEVPDPADIPRFKPHGVIASTQAIFAIPDATALENYAPILGPERAMRAMPFKSLDDAGAMQAFGSDYPVFPMDPLLGIHVATTRTTAAGTPSGGWNPAERISAQAAIRHYTTGAAYAAFREAELGRLMPGMYADFTVLSEDIVDGAADVFLRAKVLLTVMGGRDTHRATSGSPP
ncbi:MAG: amidohydrolase [Gemmatimonadaceae bacterium]|nr:amidohydrolase [Gemmatimonadaceae bacterium]